MAAAKENAVVGTERCGRDANGEGVEVRLGDAARISWNDGSSCSVLKLAERWASVGHRPARAGPR